MFLMILIFSCTLGYLSYFANPSVAYFNAHRYSRFLQDGFDKVEDQKTLEHFLTTDLAHFFHDLGPILKNNQE